LENRSGFKTINGKGLIRTKEGITNIYKHKNTLNHKMIDILAAPCMHSVIENGFIDSYSSSAYAGVIYGPKQAWVALTVGPVLVPAIDPTLRA